MKKLLKINFFEEKNTAPFFPGFSSNEANSNIFAGLFASLGENIAFCLKKLFF